MFLLCFHILAASSSWPLDAGAGAGDTEPEPDADPEPDPDAEPEPEAEPDASCGVEEPSMFDSDSMAACSSTNMSMRLLMPIK